LKREEKNMQETRILIADGLHDRGKEILSAAAQVDDHTGISAGGLLEAIPEYDALVVRGRSQVSDEVLAASTRL
jgi:hypothetical protein